MWILKGILLGTWLFMFGTIAFLYFAFFRRFPPGGAIAVTLLTAYTTRNPLWWAALAACIVLGCAFVGSWPGKGFSPIFWIVLLVTDLVPLGLLGLFLVLVAKLRGAVK